MIVRTKSSFFCDFYQVFNLNWFPRILNLVLSFAFNIQFHFVSTIILAISIVLCYRTYSAQFLSSLCLLLQFCINAISISGSQCHTFRIVDRFLNLLLDLCYLGMSPGCINYLNFLRAFDGIIIMIHPC